ncbi:EboA domain-containing protein [Embleya sp. NBC_00896]|uniref:EboA domain-containing protein n=1 Tax=Embleya sp. NBC_00896 TaxID=2975961 RepID=UPI002F918788|nr:EboA domain-containing protein [Embleya sp. NBC_00896]
MPDHRTVEEEAAIPGPPPAPPGHGVRPDGPPDPDMAELRAVFAHAVGPDRRDWPVEAAAEPARLATAFASAGRLCGRAPLAELPGWTCDDAARVLLLHAVSAAAVREFEPHAGGGRTHPASGDLPALVRALYERGDAHERRAILRALPYLPAGSSHPPGPNARTGPDPQADVSRLLVEDALRTNDHRLVAAAMGPCGYRALGSEAWRHGVLKCVFLGLPLGPTVTGLGDRADAELARMLADFASERAAAGRAVPADIAPITSCFTPTPEEY